MSRCTSWRPKQQQQHPSMAKWNGPAFALTYKFCIHRSDGVSPKRNAPYENRNKWKCKELVEAKKKQWKYSKDVPQIVLPKLLGPTWIGQLPEGPMDILYTDFGCAHTQTPIYTQITWKKNTSCVRWLRLKMRPKRFSDENLIAFLMRLLYMITLWKL